MDNFNVSDFWQRVKTLCKANGLTQKELSVKLGLEPRIIESQIYTKVIPNVEEVLNIAKVLNVSLNFLVTGTETDEFKDKFDTLIQDIQDCIDSYK